MFVETVSVSATEPSPTPAASASHPSTPALPPLIPPIVPHTGASPGTLSPTAAAPAVPPTSTKSVVSNEPSASVTAANTSQPPRDVNDITVVHATAIFEDSPCGTLIQEDYNSLQKFILSEEHLVKNICHLESHHLSSRELRSCAFKHTLEIKIHVKCSNLWEPARTYIWKHLGKADYKRSNGTRINLVKIHVK